MSFKSLLIANRCEIAIRIARAASDLGIPSVAVFSKDDSASLHTRVSENSRLGIYDFVTSSSLLYCPNDFRSTPPTLSCRSGMCCWARF